jgi:hypothetical protein
MRLVITLAVAMVGCSMNGMSGEVRARLEIEVHRALLDTAYATPGASNAAEILVSEHFAPSGFAYPDDRVKWLRDSVPELPTSAIRDFGRSAADSSVIAPFDLPRHRMRVVPDSTVQRFFHRDAPGGPQNTGWIGFRRAFPNGAGIVTLSRVGLSSDGRWAIVYGGQQADWLAGAGYIYVLHRDPDKWRIRRQLNVWVS